MRELSRPPTTSSAICRSMTPSTTVMPRARRGRTRGTLERAAPSVPWLAARGATLGGGVTSEPAVDAAMAISAYNAHANHARLPVGSHPRLVGRIGRLVICTKTHGSAGGILEGEDDYAETRFPVPARRGPPGRGAARLRPRPRAECGRERASS